MNERNIKEIKAEIIQQEQFSSSESDVKVSVQGQDEKKTELQVREDTKDTIVEIVQFEAQFNEFVRKYERAIKTILKALKEGVDWGYPFEGADKKVLLLPGAQKLCEWFNLQVTEAKDEEIIRNGEFWGYKISLTLEGKKKKVVSTGIATYSERKMWNEIKSTKEKYKKEEHFLWQMAYKRAFVKAVINYCSLSSYFVEEEYQQSEKEVVQEKRFYEIPPEKLIKSAFLKPGDYEKIFLYLKEGKRTKSDISIFIQKLMPKRNKQNLHGVAVEWAKFVNETEPTIKATETYLRQFIDKCREKAISQNSEFAKFYNFVLEQIQPKQIEGKENASPNASTGGEDIGRLFE